MHAGLITLWAGAMSLFETAHYVVKNLSTSKDSSYFPTWPLSLLVLVQVVKSTQLIHFYHRSFAYHCVWYIRSRRNITFYFWPGKVRRNKIRYAFCFFVAGSIQGIHSFRSTFNYFRFRSILLYIQGVYFGGLMTHCHQVEETFGL